MTSDAREELWKMYDNHIVHGRHHEVQRSTVVGLVLAIATALLGIAAIDRQLADLLDAALGLALLGLGIFGAGFAMKHSERWDLHMARARGYRNALDELLTGHPLKRIKELADYEHNKKYPKLHKMRLRTWWVALNLGISAVGIVVAVIALRFPITTTPG